MWKMKTHVARPIGDAVSKCVGFLVNSAQRDFKPVDGEITRRADNDEVSMEITVYSDGRVDISW